MKAFDEITFMAHRIIDNQTKATNNPKTEIISQLRPYTLWYWEEKTEHTRMTK